MVAAVSVTPFSHTTLNRCKSQAFIGIYCKKPELQTHYYTDIADYLIGPCHVKTCLRACADSEGQDQLA